MVVRSAIGGFLVALSATAWLGGCAVGTRAATAGGHLRVVAAENMWGSIAAELGGDRVTVRSIIANPNADPHAYEPTPSDARMVAAARLLILNGIGYDPWAPKLAATTPQRDRAVLDVGDVLGLKPGANPHRWYSPPDVARIIDAITADYKRLEPGSGPYFDERHSTFVSARLAEYHGLIGDIRARYAGTAIGASESIVTPLADALGLEVKTPATFLNAITEGGEPTVSDKATIDAQIRTHQIKAYVYNTQNTTPDITAQVAEARTAGIPVATVTETISPTGASFEDWQVAELRGLEAALAAGK